MAMPSADIVGMASAVAAALSAIFAFLATRQARLQIESADKSVEAANRSVEASVFLDIHNKWNDIYPQYRKLLSEPFDSQAVIAANANFASYATTPEWQRMRPVFAFHEYLGACLGAGLLREETLFSLVAVNPALWDKFAPMVLHFRIQGQEDLYTAWEFLVTRRRAAQPAKRLSSQSARSAQARVVQ